VELFVIRWSNHVRTRCGCSNRRGVGSNQTPSLTTQSMANRSPPLRPSMSSDRTRVVLCQLFQWSWPKPRKQVFAASQHHDLHLGTGPHQNIEHEFNSVIIRERKGRSSDSPTRPRCRRLAPADSCCLRHYLPSATHLSVASQRSWPRCMRLSSDARRCAALDPMPTSSVTTRQPSPSALRYQV
jgi:hypothetical protein